MSSLTLDIDVYIFKILERKPKHLDHVTFSSVFFRCKIKKIIKNNGSKKVM